MLRAGAVLQTALEIAEACAFLHSHGIVHGVRAPPRRCPRALRPAPAGLRAPGCRPVPG